MAEDKKINNYTDDNIRTLEGVEHIRLRPGMYIGALGNGDDPSDGIYVLLKEVVDNSIDEFSAGFGKQIQITVTDKDVTVRDYVAFSLSSLVPLITTVVDDDAVTFTLELTDRDKNKLVQDLTFYSPKK